MHHVLFERVSAVGQRHLAGDLGLRALRSHLTRPWIVAAHSACPPQGYTENHACDTESRSASMQKSIIMAARKAVRTAKSLQGTKCPTSKSATSRWSTT